MQQGHRLAELHRAATVEQLSPALRALLELASGVVEPSWPDAAVGALIRERTMERRGLLPEPNALANAVPRPNGESEAGARVRRVLSTIATECHYPRLQPGSDSASLREHANAVEAGRFGQPEGEIHALHRLAA